MYTAKQLSDSTASLDVDALATTSNSGDEVIAKFKTAWPSAKMFLTNAKILTGTKGDKVIDDIIVAGDAINGNATGDALKAAIKKITDVWHAVRFPLNLAAKIIPGKAGKAMRVFIQIVDDLCDQYPS